MSIKMRVIPVSLIVGLCAIAAAARAILKNQTTRTVPSGTELSVRTNENIDSKSAHQGQTYSGIVNHDVVDSSGAVLIPKGSSVELVVRRIAGQHNLALGIRSVTVNGQRYTVNTAELSEKSQGLGKNRRTAEMVGGGAAIGTLLGAVIGHGKGAAIGAVSGAAAGAGVEILTQGKEVRVPAETVLTFRLDRPLTLRATRGATSS